MMNSVKTTSAMLIFFLTSCTSNVTTPSISENKQTADNAYTCDYKCDSMTTGGIIEWAIKMQEKEESRINVLTTNLLELSDQNTSKAIKKEIIAWNDLCTSLDQTTSQILKLKWWFGGSYGNAVKASTPLEIRFIRRACLDDDYNLLNGHNAQKCSYDNKNDIDIIECAVDSAMSQVSMANVDSSLFEYKYYGTLEEYEQCLNLCRNDAAKLKFQIKKWLEARNEVALTLNKNIQKTYYNHNQKTINFLSKVIYGCLAD